MASRTIAAIVSFGLHALFANSLMVQERSKSITTLADPEDGEASPRPFLAKFAKYEIEEKCSVCAMDTEASWEVKCTYTNSCGLCPDCASDKKPATVDDDDTPATPEDAESSESSPLNDDAAATPEDAESSVTSPLDDDASATPEDAESSVTSPLDDDAPATPENAESSVSSPLVAPSTDAAPHRGTLVKHLADEQSEETRLKPKLGNGIAEGCPRGHDCGYEGGVTKEAVKVPCKKGERWMSPNAIVIRGQKGYSAIYCSVPKIGTSYTMGVLEELRLQAREGNRNAAYENVGEIVKKNDTQEVEELCEAYSFIIIRNPWERIVSAYVDKVLTREVFKEPPNFNYFMQSLANVKHPENINQHFRPASELCHTSGPQAMKYDEKIKMEGDARGSVRDHLEKIFITKLKIAPERVHHVLNEFDAKTHPTTSGSRWEGIDFSLNSGLSRVDYYFQMVNPNVAAKVYKDDIEYGGYQFRR